MALVGVEATRTQVGIRHELDIKETGHTTKVEDDCRVKLMYYLHCFSCISKFLEVHSQWRKYTNYYKNKAWAIEEEEELYHICNYVITVPTAQEVGFIEVPDYLIKSENKFFDVTDRNEVILNQVHVHLSEDSIYAANRLIGGKREIKIKVMMYRKSWINQNYYNPLNELSGMINRHKREKREAEETERRTIHNEEIVNQKRSNCCLITKRDDSQHEKLVKFILVLYFIHALTLLILYLHSDTKYYVDMPWLKWIHLAGFIVSIINTVISTVCIILVCISSCYEKWIIYVRLLIIYMIFLSTLSIPISYFMFTYFVVAVIQMLISTSLLCFSCVLCKETKVKPACLCICYGAIKVSPEKIDYYL